MIDRDNTERTNDPGRGRAVQVAAFFQMGHTFISKVLIAACRAVLVLLLVQAFVPADFGAYSLITTNLTFALVLAGLNTNLLIYRAVPGTSLAEGRRIFVSVSMFELSLALAIGVFSVTSGAVDAMLIALHVETYRGAFVLALAWAWVELLCQQLLNYLYARQQIGHANILELIKQVAWLPLPVLIWYLRGHLAVEDVVSSVLLGASLAAVFGLLQVRPRGRPSLGVIVLALQIATPLIVPQLAFYGLKLVDRYILSATRTLDETGVYSLVATVANLLYSLSALVVANTMTPMAVRAHNEGRMADRDRLLWQLTKYSLWLFGVSSAVAMALAAVLIPRLRSEYAEATALLPLVIVGYGLIVLASAPQTALWLAGRVRRIVMIDVVSTSAALALDLITIPILGAYGAALGTIVGFGVAAIAKQRASRLSDGFAWREIWTPWTEAGAAVRLIRAAVRRT